jgi:sulfonate transport system substrate-binding protein
MAKFRSTILGAVILGAVLSAMVWTGALHAEGSGVTLRMGDQKGGSQALMSAAGALAELPYRLEWSEFAAAAPLLEALNAGAIDGGHVGDAPFTFAVAAGVPVRAIAAVRQNQDGLAIVVPASSPIRSLEDLKGRRIGTGKGSIGHYLVLAAYDHAGLLLSQAGLVFLGAPDAKAALTGGGIDAWSTWEPYTSMVELEGGRRVVDGRGITPGLGFQIARPEAIRDKRAALEDYVIRLTRARQWALDHVDEYADHWARLMNLPAPVARQWYERARIRGVPIDDEVEADEQRVVDLYVKSGLIRTRVDVAPALDRSFNAAIEHGGTRK